MRELKRTGDLRAIRTRENIENAFLELLSQKELPNIRVKEICDIARVSRVTFYDHYKDVYYLMDQISRFSAESLCNLLLKKLDGEDTAMEHFSLVYDKIIVSKGAQRIYPLPTNYEYYLLSSTRILNSLLEADAKKYNFPLTDTLPYITEFISFGLIGIYKKW